MTFPRIGLLQERMVQQMRYKGHTISDAEIDKMMDKLDLSLEEACDMILADKEMIVDETVEELTKKAHKNRVTTTIHDAKGEKKERKPREKKENPLKKQIISAICVGFNDENWLFDEVIDDLVIRNDEKYIDLVVDGREFTINLVEHRKKKG